VPEPVTNPRRRGSVEAEAHFDGSSPHNDERVLHVLVDIEAEGHLARPIGNGDGSDAVHREHANVAAKVAVTDEVEGALSVPETIGVRAPRLVTLRDAEKYLI
jgi:hypothetical protein